MEKRDFAACVRELRGPLRVSALVPWSRWITPGSSRMTTRRFDNRQFLARVPPEQSLRPDGYEVTLGVWLKPRAALQQFSDGQIALAPPQLMTLAHLARFATVDAAWAHARQRPPPCVRPIFVDEGDDRILCFPGDARHPLRARLVPGLCRLLWRQDRYEFTQPTEGCRDVDGL